MAPTKKGGSITVEAAIVLPLFISVILIFTSFLICIIATNCMYSSLYKTANFFSDYGYIYHEKGLKRVEDTLIRDLSNVIEDDETKHLLQEMNIRQLAEAGDNFLYNQVAKSIFMYYLSKEPAYKSGLVKFSSVSFTGSSFFDSRDDVVLIARGLMKLPVPVQERLIEGFEIRAKVKFRCFINGDMGSYTEGVPIESSIWNLSNFERGRKIRQVFGSNLPSNYPVIAKFENGKATMIKSLDHTASTYQDTSVFVRTIKSMVDELANFNGRSYGGVVINGSDIKMKELLLVMPTNDLTPAQEFSLIEIRTYCIAKNVIFIIERYQEKT